MVLREISWRSRKRAHSTKSGEPYAPTVVKLMLAKKAPFAMLDRFDDLKPKSWMNALMLVMVLSLLVPVHATFRTRLPPFA